MNKIIKITLCTVMVISCLLGFSACGKKEDATSETESVVKQYMVGRYELQSVEWASGTTASGSTLQQSEDAMGDMYVELFSDGTAQLSLYGQTRDMEFTDDEMHQIDSKLNTYEFSVGGGKVILKQSGDKYTFVKE